MFERRIYGKKYFRQEQAADAIKSLPLPIAENAERFAESAASEMAGNTGENLSAAGDLAGFEALMHRYSLMFARKTEINVLQMLSEFYAEIEKLKGE